MAYGKAICTIYKNLQEGKRYGKQQNNVKYPYFDTVLYGKWGYHNSRARHYICWNHYGSSANRFTQADLSWIIREIFRTTPEEFLQTYECREW